MKKTTPAFSNLAAARARASLLEDPMRSYPTYTSQQKNAEQVSEKNNTCFFKFRCRARPRLPP